MAAAGAKRACHLTLVALALLLSLAGLSHQSSPSSVGPTAARPKQQDGAAAAAANCTQCAVGPPKQLQRRSALEPASSIFDSILGITAPPAATTEGGAPQAPPPSSSSKHRHKSADKKRQQQQQQVAAARPPGAASLLAPLSSSSDKVTLPGDILLGGLFPIHMKGEYGQPGLLYAN